MSCSGVCTLCGMSRDSRLCTCLQRRHNSDPIHESLADAETFIRETRFFGNQAHEDALAKILAERQVMYAKVTDGTITDSTILIRIDRDAKRLKELADGKLYNTRQKMAEKPQSRSERIEDGLTNLQRLRKGLINELPRTVAF